MWKLCESCFVFLVPKFLSFRFQKQCSLLTPLSFLDQLEPLVLNYTNARDLPDPVGYTGIPLSEVLPSFKICHLPHCGMKCLNTSFARHLKSHTGVFQQCGKCGFQTDRVKVFQKHLKSHQPKKILRTCTAEHCTFETSSEHEFAKHVKKHTGVYVKCQDCNDFVSDIKSVLMDHRKSYSRGYMYVKC